MNVPTDMADPGDIGSAGAFTDTWMSCGVAGPA